MKYKVIQEIGFSFLAVYKKRRFLFFKYWSLIKYVKTMEDAKDCIEYDKSPEIRKHIVHKE